jgi:hypothetical protein
MGFDDQATHLFIPASPCPVGIVPYLDGKSFHRFITGLNNLDLVEVEHREARTN